jgi:hypothetical protein
LQNSTMKVGVLRGFRGGTPRRGGSVKRRGTRRLEREGNFPLLIANFPLLTAVPSASSASAELCAGLRKGEGGAVGQGTRGGSPAFPSTMPCDGGVSSFVALCSFYFLTQFQ